MKGERFTWHNCSTNHRSLWKRLDRVLVNDSWLGRWLEVFYDNLTPRTSDHSSLVLRSDLNQSQVRMFRFDNYLALSPGFLSSIHDTWQHQIVGTPMYSVTRKLKALKPVFRRQRKSKGDLSLNVKLANEFLEIAQTILQLDRHNCLLLHVEHCYRLVFLKATKLEHVMLQQRAKIQWLKGGDQCSRVFFHKVATRRASKRIYQISDEEGHTYLDPDGINDMFVDYYRRLLGGTRSNGVLDLRYLRPWAKHILTVEEGHAMIRPVTKDEVKWTVFDIAEDKAPGPDGYSSGFYKAAWSVVGDEVTRAVLDFFATGRLLKQVNALLTLIPKVRSPNLVADFRSISCCNVLYKIITKILGQRISVVLDKMINPSQNAFVPGRLIGDNILLAQELFSGYKQARLPPRCALKVDLKKAYDTIE
ncbi:UNVERIFIED_CONTAM: hypothetical protein Slati_0807500 [Sesamum latifolium]|uniref:Reverse transcriptase domain-containing protein n=1 Tax=Sesamum latifolium TaxID=2727402 RepID=A0AAW2XLK1_9LAMI